MIAPPPPVQHTPATPLSLLVFTGLAGLGVAVGAGVSGFLERFSQQGFAEFFWGDVPRFVAVIALVGSVLALMRHDAGPPLVAAAGAVFAVVVGTTVLGERFEVGDFVDVFTWRALAFLAAGALGVLAAVLGLVSLRGRGKPALGVITLLAGVAVLGCHAALVRLDDRREGFVLRPFLGIAVVIGVMIIGSFVGRYGALAAAAGAACLFPLYADTAENTGFDRWQFGLIAAVALALILLMSVVATVLATRQDAVQYFAESTQAWYGQPEATQVHEVQTGGPVTEQQPSWATAQPYDSTQQLPTINEATSSLGNLFEPPPFGRDDAGTAPVATTAGQPTSSFPVSSSSFGTSASEGPAQWASDPYGRHQLRYWDGQRWTEHVSDSGTGGSDPV